MHFFPESYIGLGSVRRHDRIIFRDWNLRVRLVRLEQRELAHSDVRTKRHRQRERRVSRGCQHHLYQPHGVDHGRRRRVHDDGSRPAMSSRDVYADEPGGAAGGRELQHQHYQSVRMECIEQRCMDYAGLGFGIRQRNSFLHGGLG